MGRYSKKEKIYCGGCDFEEVDVVGKLGLWFVHREHKHIGEYSRLYSVSHIGSGIAAVIGVDKDVAMALMFELLEYEEDLKNVIIRHDYLDEINTYRATDRGKKLIEMIRMYRNMRGFRKRNKA